MSCFIQADMILVADKMDRKRMTSTGKFSQIRRSTWLSLPLLLLYLLLLMKDSSAFPEGKISESSDGTASALVHRHHHHLDNHQHRRQQRHHDDEGSEINDEIGDVTNNSSAPAPIIDQESNLSNGFWVRVAQAKAMALSVENGTLPRLDEFSHIMKPAGCRMLNDDAKCRDFVLKCADKETEPMYNEFVKSGDNSTRNDVPYFMQTIWEKCGMHNYLPTGALLNISEALFAPPDVPHPVPMFHCNSHVGRKHDAVLNFVTNFRMEYPGTISPPSNISSDMIPRFFVLEMEQRGKWEILGVQPYWLFRFKTNAGETYRIRVTAVSPKYVYQPVMSPPITLYDTSIQTIGSPENVTIESVTVDKYAARPGPSALIRWKSGSGFNASCDFDVYYMNEDMHKKEISKGDHAFWIRLDLQFEKNYTGSIMEKFGGDRESSLNFSLSIPSCFELRGYSFELCPPPPPSKVRLVNATDNYFWIVWDPPKYTNATNRILNYNLTVDWIYKPAAADGVIHSPNAHYSTERIFAGNIPGNVTAAEIKNHPHRKGKFKVSVTAISSSGSSAPSWDVVFYKGPNLKTWTVEKVLTLFLAIFGVVGLIALICLLKNFHERRQRKKKRQEKFDNYEKESLQLPQIDRDDSKWEIDCCALDLLEAIGEGNFGLVRKAILNQKGRKITVAVKTLRDGVSEKDVDKFWEEFEILKNLDPPNIHVVSLIGIVKKHVPLLVVEYCDGGDLKQHLRKAMESPGYGRKYSPGSMVNSSGSSQHQLNPAENKVRVSVVQNEAYFIREEVEVPKLTPGDLLSYARQIACGMEVLSRNKIVHRDLAARNILLSGKNRILKISDFGLSRDVYEQNWYKKSSEGNIPIKWLAPECLLKELYTTKSDVWSYGILLWEIFTYGGNPYPGAENITVFELLKHGYRMTQPERCPDDVYELMRACWAEEPCDRPDFTSIRLIIEDIMEKTTQVTYLNIESGGGGSACEEEYRNVEPVVHAARKPLPQIPLQMHNRDTFMQVY